MRVLYADFSPGLGWDGREPEVLEAATATQLTTRTVSAFLDDGVAALAAIPRPLAFLVGGTDPSHAPETATITGKVGGVATTEVVSLPTNSAGDRVAGAVCSVNPWDDTDLEVTYSAGGGTDATVAIGLGLIPGVSDLRVIAIETWLEAFPDRRRPGYLDPFQVNEIVRPSSNKIDGALATPNGNYDVPFGRDRLGDIGRIARDFCLCEAGKLKPTVFAFDYVALRRDAEKDLEKLRKAQSSVGVTPPDPAKNVGGRVGAIGDNAEPDPPQAFFDNMGDYAA